MARRAPPGDPEGPFLFFFLAIVATAVLRREGSR